MAETYRDRLFAKLKEHATGMDGADVVDALWQVSDGVYDSGIDGVFAKGKFDPDSKEADQFDAGWLTALIVRLYEMKNDK